MAGAQKEVFDKMGGDIPRRVTSTPWASGDSVVIALDSDQLAEWGISVDDESYPELHQYIHEEEEKIVIEKPDS
jgi:hypothetical protein